MTCPWVCWVVVPHAGNTDYTVQKVYISEQSAVHQNHTCLIQISTQIHRSHGLKQDYGPHSLFVAHGRLNPAIYTMLKPAIRDWFSQHVLDEHREPRMFAFKKWCEEERKKMSLSQVGLGRLVKGIGAPSNWLL